MHELTYTSIAERNINTKDLNDILDKATEFNKMHSLTGCLVYHNGQFVQTLHGDKKTIFGLFEKIKLDSRHTNVNLVWEGPAEKEVFQGWHMAYYSPDNSLNNDEGIIEFERNLVTLASFYKADSASVRIFWTIVKDLCMDEASPTV